MKMAWVSCLAVFAAMCGLSQDPAGRPKLQVIHVKANVYLIAGAGANITVQAGDQAVVLVDSGVAPLSNEVREAIHKISAKPVGYIVNTTADRDHTGGNEALAKDGFFMLTSANQQRQTASIVAHVNLLTRMNGAGDKAFAAAAANWPTDTYDGPDWKLYANDEPLLLEHPAAAHTDGDTLVFFRRSDVISAGDLFDMTRYPVIDRKHGGSLEGILKTLNHISLDLAVPKENEEGGTYIIPGHGRVCDRYDVAIYRDMLTIIRDRIQDMVKRGRSLEQVKAARPTYDYDGEFGSETGPWTTASFIETVYNELSAKKK
ncbi:MAG TPA: MBL fold metallo-hydrolase [Bryobacteraceae bacterium]|nr:MBL fold metallo-hydrolase [Bryobacteraceae bacterium]